jgi:hypothetical protein
MKQSIIRFVAAAVMVCLTGCASSPVVDDGRDINEQFMFDMTAYAAAAVALRPAIVRSASLNDSDCDTQYELPFEAITSDGVYNSDTKIAWMRAIGVDENLNVIASVPSSGVRQGDIITGVAGQTERNGLELNEALQEARDSGEPFALQLDNGKQVTITPFKVCRGHVVVASPLEPTLQQYHWTQTVHPLEVFRQPLTPDEAQWIELWTQGLSERGGGSMRTYAFITGAAKWAAVLALGFVTSGATTAVQGATAAGSSSAGSVAAVQIAGSAASITAQAAANRASLSGVNRVAASVFDRADQWAFESMQILGMDPRAGLTLHNKLRANKAVSNAFFLDEKRLANMRAMIAQLPATRRVAPRAAANPPAGIDAQH